jgi:preprotein translocase subunit SecA
MQTQLPDDSPLESDFITKSLDSAQERVEERAYQQRKNLFDYDDVLNKQRNIVYHERRQILESLSVQKNILLMVNKLLQNLLLELKENKTLKKKFYFYLKIYLEEFSFKSTLKIKMESLKFDLYELKLLFI